MDISPSGKRTRHLSSQVGASVLAALVFVAILGAVAAGLNYAGTLNGKYAYTNQSMTATAAASTPAAASSQAGSQSAPSGDNQPADLANCEKYNAGDKQQVCACDQKHQTNGNNVEEICLPGCKYDVTAPKTAGQPSTIKVVGGADSTTPNSSSWIKVGITVGELKQMKDQCQINYCDAAGKCTPIKSSAGLNLSSPSEVAAAAQQQQQASDAQALANKIIAPGTEAKNAAAQVAEFRNSGGNMTELYGALQQQYDASGQTGDPNANAKAGAAIAAIDGYANASCGAGMTLAADGYSCVAGAASNLLNCNGNNMGTCQPGGVAEGGPGLNPGTAQSGDPGSQFPGGMSGDTPSVCTAAMQQSTGCSAEAWTPEGVQTLRDAGYTCTGSLADGSMTCDKAPQAPAMCTPGSVGCSNVPQPKGPTTLGGGAGAGAGSGLGAGGIAQILGGLAKGFTGNGAGGLGGSGNSAPPAGNQTPQAPGTCAAQNICSGNTLLYRNNQCVDQPMQQCQNGCSGNACSQQSQSPYGTGTNGQPCYQPPQQPDPSTCTTGTWRAQSASSNGCTTGWQCVPANGTAVSASAATAQISCQPQVADVGMNIAISYACQNSVSSAGSGFDTGGQLSGSATASISNPPAGANTATFGVACTNSAGATTGAQCSVQISQASIVIVANPAAVASGGTTSIGWVTTGMQSCVVSSPDQTDFTSRNAGYTSVNGTATTSPITKTTTFNLQCQTLGGGTRSASTVVSIGTGGNTLSGGSVSVSSSAEGTTLAHGGTASITWQTSNAPSGSVIALWLVDVASNQAISLIAGAQPTSGTYTWNIPAAGSTCNASAANVCASDLVAGKQYSIEAVLYTPSNAYIGDGAAPANPISATYGNDALTNQFTSN